MKHNHSRKAKALAFLLALAMTVALLPVFASLAEEDPSDDALESLKAENGNLAIGATILSQYGAHSDPSWGWDINLLNDGTLNTLTSPDSTAETNGGYHTKTDATNEWGQNIFNLNHSEWVGYQFDEPKTFDTVVVYPSRDEDGVCWGMPNAFAIDVSVDGETFVRVYETYNYAIPDYGPQTIQFEAVTANYVRFVALSVNRNFQGTWAIKLCELAVYNKGYTNTTPYCPNLAEGKPVESTPWHNSAPTWTLNNINDGDAYNMVTTAYDWGQFGGWHTDASGATPTDQDAWIEIDLKDVTTVDKVVVWPSTERYRNGLIDGAWSDALALPASMTIQLSEDGESWTDVETKTDMPTDWEAIEFSFAAKEARYVRLYMVRSGHVKLSEIEVYNTADSVTPGEEVKVETVVKTGVNLALDAKIMYSSVIGSNSWAPTNLNNGVVETDGGFTTAVETTLWVGYEFAAPTLVNKVVLYAANPLDDVDLWSGIPMSYKIQYSLDNLNWYDAASCFTADPVPGQEAVTVTFSPVEAKYLRIWTNEPWPKPSDGGRTYIQLAEMEVWLDPASLTAGDNAFAAFYQVKENSDASKQDLRILLVANMKKLSTVQTATVKVTFTLADGTTKTLTKKLAVENSDYELYKTITAAGDSYTAADGYALFGDVITNIPDGAYTAIDLTVTDDGGNTLLSVSSK